jgi:cell division protein FtsA
MKKENLITAIDIGASKVCCLIAALPKSKGILDVLGYGICHHDCLKKGVVADIKALSEAISDAVERAEETSGKKVQSAFFNISGTHLKGILSHGEVVISDRDNEITRHDLDRVISNAKAIHMPYERDIVYSARRGFVVDGEKGIINPVGMFGIKLETELFLITAKISIIDNLKKAINQSGIGVEGYIISPLATSASSVSQHEKSLGLVFIDIGADITEILVFSESRPVFLKVLPLGGDTITRKIAEKLSLPEGIAEKLKIENSTIEDIKRDELRDILISEYTNLFNIIKKELDISGYIDSASSGALICGQPVIMDGVLELAENIFNLPVKMGHIMSLGSAPKPLPSHIYATAVGLLKMGSIVKQSKKSIFKMGPKNWATAVIDYTRRLYTDYF